MRIASRLVSVFVVIAHVWVAGVPCAPGSAGFGDERIALSVAEAEALLALARAESPSPATAHAHAADHGDHDTAHSGDHSASAAAHHGTHAAHAPRAAERGRSAQGASESVATTPPCHAPAAEPEVAVVVEPAPFEGQLLFFLPACPCGCDQRGPIAGASSVRIGAGVPPASLLDEPAPLRIVELGWRSAPAPDVQPALPDPVPRPHSLA